MNYPLDTNHWSSLQRNHPAVVTRIHGLPEEATLYVPVVAQAELLGGVELINNEPRQRQLRALYEHAVAQANGGPRDHVRDCGTLCLDFRSSSA